MDKVTCLLPLLPTNSYGLIFLTFTLLNGFNKKIDSKFQSVVSSSAWNCVFAA